MAVVATNLTTSGSATHQSTPFTTASVTPGANDLILLWTYTIGASLPGTPTISGCNLTWTTVTTVSDGSGLRLLALIQGQGASPTTGSISINWGATFTASGCVWSVIDCSGINTGTPLVTSNTQSNSNSGTVTSLTVTMNTLSNPNNLFVGGFGIPLNTAGLPEVDSGYTLLGNAMNASPSKSIGSQYGTNTACKMDSGSNTVPWTGIAVEVANASVVPTATYIPYLPPFFS